MENLIDRVGKGEAQSRTIELVRQAAMALEKEEKGVWALLGKPYVCFGEPIEFRIIFVGS